MLLVATALLLPPAAQAHGMMTWPPNRANGTLALAGDCLTRAPRNESSGSCFWFSQPAQLPGKDNPLLNEKRFRTMNIDVAGGKKDYTRRNPWRSPGRAPVLGSGCGVSGGGVKRPQTAGFPVPRTKLGDDALAVTSVAASPAVWKRGSVVETAFALWANHGGGYSWRLCPNDGHEVSEKCFQANTLEFAGDSQELRHGDPAFHKNQRIVNLSIPRVTWIDPETGANWARNPVPVCNLCDMSACAENRTATDAEKQFCFQKCSGLGVGHANNDDDDDERTSIGCPPNSTQFPEPAPGISGFGVSGHGFAFNIVDKVKVPANLPAGEYLLSWRWDCEQSNQVWQNCADVSLV